VDRCLEPGYDPKAKEILTQKEKDARNEKLKNDTFVKRWFG
jgi:hypothetical protein